MFKEIKNAGDHRFPLRGGTRQWLRGRNKLRSSANYRKMSSPSRQVVPPLPKGEALKKVAAIDNARPYIIMRETTGLHYGLKEATGERFTRTLCTCFPGRVINFGEKRLYKFLKKADKGRVTVAIYGKFATIWV